MREANEGWATFVAHLVDSRYAGKQSALAESVGVSPSTVTRWLDGATPAIQQLRALSDALDYTMVDLLRAAGALDGAEVDGGKVSAPTAILADVAEAIRQDAALLEEAKQHLLNQYELLLRLSPPVKARRGRPARPEDESIDERRERLRREHEARTRRERNAQQQDGGGRSVAAGGGSGGRLGGSRRDAAP